MYHKHHKESMMELGYSAMGPCICGISAFKQNDKTTAKYFNHWDWDVTICIICGSSGNDT